VSEQEPWHPAVVRARSVVAVALGGIVVAGAAHGAVPRDARAPQPPRPTVAHHAAGSSSACLRPGTGRLAYHYPIRPFLQQHPIRGNFGDPRTFSTGAFGADSRRTPGSYSFHNGVDIVALTGTPVYPVVSGTAKIGYADEVMVVTGDGRTFQYFHIRPAVRPGQHVVASRTVLGRVLPEWGHVHLSEIDGFRAHNPADPGHLTPYTDGTIPVVTRVLFRDDRGRALPGTALHGLVDLAAQAQDVPPLVVPGAWFDHPVTPAVVSWRLVTATHRVVRPWRTVVDFRATEPPNRDFWRIYSPGTFQNFPVFSHRYFFGAPGRYVFALTHEPLDTRRLGNGRYVVDVRVADVCGNWSVRAEPVSVLNPRA
jgi:hypothetical protein